MCSFSGIGSETLTAAVDAAYGFAGAAARAAYRETPVRPAGPGPRGHGQACARSGGAAPVTFRTLPHTMGGEEECLWSTI